MQVPSMGYAHELSKRTDDRINLAVRLRPDEAQSTVRQADELYVGLLVPPDLRSQERAPRFEHRAGAVHFRDAPQRRQLPQDRATISRAGGVMSVRAQHGSVVGVGGALDE